MKALTVLSRTMLLSLSFATVAIAHAEHSSRVEIVAPRAGERVSPPVFVVVLFHLGDIDLPSFRAYLDKKDVTQSFSVSQFGAVGLLDDLGPAESRRDMHLSIWAKTQRTNASRGAGRTVARRRFKVEPATLEFYGNPADPLLLSSGPSKGQRFGFAGTKDDTGAPTDLTSMVEWGKKSSTRIDYAGSYPIRTLSHDGTSFELLWTSDNSFLMTAVTPAGWVTTPIYLPSSSGQATIGLAGTSSPGATTDGTPSPALDADSLQSLFCPEAPVRISVTQCRGPVSRAFVSLLGGRAPPWSAVPSGIGSYFTTLPVCPSPLTGFEEICRRNLEFVTSACAIASKIDPSVIYGGCTTLVTAAVAAFPELAPFAPRLWGGCVGALAAARTSCRSIPRDASQVCTPIARVIDRADQLGRTIRPMVSVPGQPTFFGDAVVVPEGGPVPPIAVSLPDPPQGCPALVSGRWEGLSGGGSTDGTTECTSTDDLALDLRQSGTDLTGTATFTLTSSSCGAPPGVRSYTITGSIEGNQLLLSGTREGGRFLNFYATVSGSAMTGSYGGGITATNVTSYGTFSLAR